MSTGKFTRVLILAVWLSPLPGAPDCRPCHDRPPPLPLGKTMGLNEMAVGVLDKGQVQVNTGNFGMLADFHTWFTNAAHWPRQARDDRQYAFGLGLLVGIDPGNVIETATQGGAFKDWLPLDDAAGHEYSGEVTAVSDETPFLASSDFHKTWPLGYYDQDGDWVSTAGSGQRYWPGPFRIDVSHPGYPDTLVEKEGEFTSDRDIYCVYDDAENPLVPGGVGIEVEQSSYSFGRPYAEDMLFWDMNIHNVSGADLKGIYVGLLAKFRPDYDNHDYLNFIDSDDDGRRDLVYVYDVNNQRNRTWAETDDPMAMVGVRVFDTPYDLGITDFHHFSHDYRLETDSLVWAVMSSTADSPALRDSTGNIARMFFHGADSRLDYTGEDSLDAYYTPWKEEDSGETFGGQAVDYIVSCGPFDLPAGASVPFSLALIMGDAGETPFAPDTSDLMENVRVANNMYSLRFQGSGPPAPPEVFAVAGDRSVTLYWTAEPSESSRDVLTEETDFEGYKIFRSTTNGLSWGDEITNATGDLAGYNPIAIFDLVDDVSGEDPAYPQILGTNSGLVYSFTDENLINGLEYWYCVTAYDRGTQDPDAPEQSYMYPLGASIFESHTVSVIPGPKAVDLQPEDNLLPIGGICGGTVRVVITDTSAVTGHGYKITFAENAVPNIDNGDTTWSIGFALVDTTSMDTLMLHQPVPVSAGEYPPEVDGFQLLIQNVEFGVESMGWTKVAGDTCTFDWRYKSIAPGAGAQLVQEAVYTTDDWRITVDYTPTGGTEAFWYDAFSGTMQEDKQHLPITVEAITDPEYPIDVSEHTWLNEFAIPAPESFRQDYYSPLGWDLVPGGPGYLPASRGWYEKHVDFLEFVKIDLDPATGDTLLNFIRLFTNNKPDTSFNVSNELEVITAVAPSDGDEFTILTSKPFRNAISYTFGTPVPHKSRVIEDPLSNIRVVPDPYVVTNIWETSEFGKKLQFNHLPSECTIRIFTLAGEHVATVPHPAAGSEGRGFVFWDMRNKHDQFIAPGVYLYAVTTNDGHKKLGRFLVIK